MTFTYEVIITDPKCPSKTTHSPFTILSVTSLFTLLMSETLPDFRYSVQICHNSESNKQTNQQTHTFPFTILSAKILFTLLIYETFHDSLIPWKWSLYPLRQKNKQRAVHNLVQTFHTVCSTVTYHCTFRYHLCLPLPFFSSINSNHIKYLH